MDTARIVGALRVVPLALALTLAAGPACSSTSTGDGGATERPPGASDASVPDASDGTDAASTSAPPGDASVADAPTGECAFEGDQTSCVACCSKRHEDGAAVYVVAVVECMCVPANCAQACDKTLCDPDDPQNADATCQACVQAKNSACAPTVTSTCTADAACVAFDTCVADSGCMAK